MNNGGESLKKQAIDKAKSIASGAVPGSNSNGKKRRKQDLKPIVSPATATTTIPLESAV